MGRYYAVKTKVKQQLQIKYLFKNIVLHYDWQIVTIRSDFWLKMNKRVCRWHEELTALPQIP